MKPTLVDNHIYPGELARIEKVLVENRRKVAQGLAPAGDKTPLFPAPGNGDAEKAYLSNDTVGVALSGGGIRSATFCLGVFQALAACRLVRKVDFLSSVSGGGYFGSFLGAWINRGYDPLPVVERKLEDDQSGASPPEELQWLRENGRYVSPNGAGDMFYNVASYLRNCLSLNTTMAVLVLTGLSGLLLLQLDVKCVLQLAQLRFHDPWLDWVTSLFVAAGRIGVLWWSPWICLPIAVFLAWTVPSGWAYWLTQPAQFKSLTSYAQTVTVVIIAGISWYLGLTKHVFGHVPGERCKISFAIIGFISVLTLFFWGVAMSMPPKKPQGDERNHKNFKVSKELAADLEADHDIVEIEGQARRRLTLCLKMSLLVLAITLAVALFDTLGQTVYALIMAAQGVSGIHKLVSAALGLAGISSIGGGVSKLFQFFTQISKNRSLSLPLNLLITGGSLLALSLILISLSATMHAVAWQGQEPPDHPGEKLMAAWGIAKSGKQAYTGTMQAKFTTNSLGETTDGGVASLTGVFSLASTEVETNAATHLEAGAGAKAGTNPVTRTQNRTLPGSPPKDAVSLDSKLIGAIFIAGLLLSWVLGNTMTFLNLSSLQQVYAYRLVRAYLGASNRRRMKNGRMAIFASDLVAGDQIRMEDYAPHLYGGPLHIINVTVNETVDSKSQVEQRDRKGMGMAVGPGGLSVGLTHHGTWCTLGEDPENDQMDLRKPRDYSRLMPILIGTRFHLFALKAKVDVVKQVVDNGVLMSALTFTKDLLASKVKLTARMLLNRMPRASKSMYHFANRIMTPEPDNIVHLESVPLGNWVSVSGAAVSTGLGAKTNLGMSLAMGLMNVRLGYWWNSGVDPVAREGGQSPGLWVTEVTDCFPVQSYLLDEYLARFHGPARKLWYLSDGGHFENTGAYELIRRRVRFIIVCDNGCDPDYAFEDLANLVRKARIDFGAEIEFLRRKPAAKNGDSAAAAPPGQNEKQPEPQRFQYLEDFVPPELQEMIGDLEDFEPATSSDKDKSNGDDTSVHRTRRHALLATVKYSQAADERNEHGSWLLVLKPSIVGDEPLDIIQYQNAHPTFPQESTAEQFFDEAQWESYRKLGEHIGNLFFSQAGKSGDAVWSPYRMFRQRGS